MPSDSKKKEMQRKKDARNKKITVVKDGKKDDLTNGTNGTANGKIELTEEELLCAKLEEEARINAEARAVTGSLAVHAKSRDVKIDNFSITFYGSEMLQDTTLELNCGRRYGLLGSNGCGKSSMLSAIGNREIPIPTHIDIFHLTREIPASTKTALECVMEVDEERVKLEKLAESLITKEDDESQEQLMDIYDRLDEISADQAEAKASRLLHGLGFDKKMQAKMAKDFSGGWRMRIALARALFVKPHLLLLDGE
jgi:ATP-binding cassette, subfamily F, member 2